MAYVLCWTGVAWQVATGVAVIIIIAHMGKVVDSQRTPALFMSVVGVARAAVEGDLITSKAEGISTQRAVPQLVVSYIFLGIALLLAMMFYPIFLHRLMATSWPKLPAIVGLATLVSACDLSLLNNCSLKTVGRARRQNVTIFQVLGGAAGQRMRFSQYARGTFFTQEVG